MSARRTASAGSLQQVTVEARQTRLSLSPDSLIIHKNGIEFRSATPFSEWAEMTMTIIESPNEGGRIHCSGVVISCTGNKHAGYHVSMVLTGMSRHAQEWFSSMAQLSLG
jgi:hypothetical protein